MLFLYFTPLDLFEIMFYYHNMERFISTSEVHSTHSILHRGSVPEIHFLKSIRFYSFFKNEYECCFTRRPRRGLQRVARRHPEHLWSG
jgi:hypothetical protein